MTHAEMFPAPIRIELEDAQPHLDFINEVRNGLDYENIHLDAIIFPSIAYISIKTFLEYRGFLSHSRGANRGLEYMGVRILMDPKRDWGAPVLLFDEDEGMKVFSKRRTS